MSALSRLVGIGCLAACLYTAQRSLEFRRHGEVVAGTVVAVDVEVRAGRGGVDYSERPEIRYTPKSGGKPMLLKASWSSVLFRSNRLGDSVDVRYLAKQPSDAREDSWLIDAGLPLVLLVLGVAGIRGRLQSDDGDSDWVIWRGRRE